MEVLKDGVIANTYPIDSKAVFYLGRSPQCDIPIDSPSASRRHALIQHKDTGEMYIYDLDSTHGTFVNSKLIPKLKYVELHVGDQFKLGVSSKVFVVGGPEELAPNEEEIKVDKREVSKLSKEEIFKKRVEQVHRLHEEREKNKIVFKHNEEGVNWGLDEDAEIDQNDDHQGGGDTSSEDEDKLGIDTAPSSELLKKNKWTEKQRSMIDKISELENKIQRLQNEKDNLIKKGESGFGELNDGQKQRQDNIEAKLLKLASNQAEIRKNLKISCGSQKKQKKNESEEGPTNIYKEEYPSDEDEYYDQTARNKEKLEQEKTIVEPQQETYETIKTKLEKLIRERQKTMDELFSKTQSKQEKEEEKVDPLDSFMKSNEQTIIQTTKAKLTEKLTTLTDEINKCNMLLKMTTPTFASLQSSKNEVTSEENTTQQKEKKKTVASAPSIADTMKRIQELSREKEIKEQERIAKALEEGKKMKETEYRNMQADEEQIQNVVAEKPIETPIVKPTSEDVLDPSNPFSEIIKNANRDEINLEDYQLFKERYNEYTQRKSELAQQKATQPQGEKKYGLQYFKDPEKNQSSFAELFPGKRPMQSADVLDPVLHKTRRIQGPTPKPGQRNESGNQEEDEEELPEKYFAGLKECNLEVEKKPHS